MIGAHQPRWAWQRSPLAAYPDVGYIRPPFANAPTAITDEGVVTATDAAGNESGLAVVPTITQHTPPPLVSAPSNGGSSNGGGGGNHGGGGGGGTPGVGGGGEFVLTLTLGPTTTAPADGSAGSVLIGGRLLVLSIVDSTGAAVTSFDHPLVLVFRPSPDDLAAAGGDPSIVPVSVYNASTGAYDSVPTVVNDDGTISAALAAIGPLHLRPALRW